jgi:hypothetical protein
MNANDYGHEHLRREGRYRKGGPACEPPEQSDGGLPAEDQAVRRVGHYCREGAAGKIEAELERPLTAYDTEADGITEEPTADEDDRSRKYEAEEQRHLAQAEQVCVPAVVKRHRR